MIPDPDQIGRVYQALLEEQDFNPALLDYSAFEERRGLLDALAMTGRSAISVFDLYQKKHIYYSPNFAAFLGYSQQEFTMHEQELYNARIHPDDFLGLTLNGISLLKLFYAFSPDEKKDFKRKFMACTEHS